MRTQQQLRSNEPKVVVFWFVFFNKKMNMLLNMTRKHTIEIIH